MAKKTVTFVATRFKNKKTNVSFYTKNGTRVAFNAVKRSPNKHKVSFTANIK